ncbi:MAG: hypothetical protein RIK87_22260 [Fuerstiella sp.]
MILLWAVSSVTPGCEHGGSAILQVLRLSTDTTVMRTSRMPRFRPPRSSTEFRDAGTLGTRLHPEG